ncbi:adenosylcobinamide-phosphate synthase CbiB [Paenibacillus sp. LHD-117]|uniref:adenosylcobinamide-phosphate synthase CbiB n=1 Tax=Paenibacillus sp. LHD-117 TaxID=3071412 RepID=UPI0027DF4468|nr:adenosylcobinamide-phosphate synthase CbiB [Paenibacillus sp. LHD-117]MDQ6421601.1 adenosylcobinamide-phosphate synthase CbiB [Paenibacillus sp. LHD-117]
MIYSFQELLLLSAAAIVIDWVVGDPKWPTHPVILIGRWIGWLEQRLMTEARRSKPVAGRLLGIVLMLSTLLLSYGIMWGIVWTADAVHPWIGYAVSAWFISSTIAVKGLKDAAMLVYEPLKAGDLSKARQYVGYIVGRDTSGLSEQEVIRATVETVSENTVDAFVSPILYALIGGAPLAMLYRAANTLDSMVGYRNDKYRYFGWCSARTDDLLNLIPARIAGLLMVAAAWLIPGMSAGKAFRSVIKFAHKHPSPNSGIPEAAAAGAMGIELGGRNVYFGVASERARMGYPTRPITIEDSKSAVVLLYTVSVLIGTGVLLLWLVT